MALIVIAIVGSLGGCGNDGPEDFAKEQTDLTVEDEMGEPVGEEQAGKEEAGKEEIEEEAADNVPREYRNALKAAQNYIDIMPFSERGLYDQLTSEYGDQYPEEAAQYAIENVEVDYNEEALKAAKNYLEIMPMSDNELFDQLTSEYGDQFTEEQARYAISNLPE